MTIKHDPDWDGTNVDIACLAKDEFFAGTRFRYTVIPWTSLLASELAAALASVIEGDKGPMVPVSVYQSDLQKFGFEVHDG